MNPAGLNGDYARQVERSSIRLFVESCADVLSGRVLDYGCGKQPYREIVDRAGGRYEPFDRASFPANVSGDDVGFLDLSGDDFDAILCNQVIQYVPQPLDLLLDFHELLVGETGALVLTGPTNWPEVEEADLHRFTLSGIRVLLQEAGFVIERLEERVAIDFPGFRLSLGWGALARPTPWVEVSSIR